MRDDGFQESVLMDLNAARGDRKIYKVFFDIEDRIGDLKILPEDATNEEPLCYVDDTGKLYFLNEDNIQYFYNADNTSDYIEENHTFTRYLKVEHFDPDNANDFA